MRERYSNRSSVTPERPGYNTDATDIDVDVSGVSAEVVRLHNEKIHNPRFDSRPAIRNPPEPNTDAADGSSKTGESRTGDDLDRDANRWPEPARFLLDEFERAGVHDAQRIVRVIWSNRDTMGEVSIDTELTCCVGHGRKLRRGRTLTERA